MHHNIFDYLQEFDNKTVDEIAEICRREQHFGFVSDSASCSLVKLLRSRMSLMVQFTYNKWMQGKWHVFMDGEWHNYPATNLYVEFAVAYDEKRLEDLINVDEKNCAEEIATGS